MNFFAQLFCEYTKLVDKVGFFEHLFLMLMFSFTIGGLFVILLDAVFCIYETLHGWWRHLRARATVVAARVDAPQGGGAWPAPAAQLRRWAARG